MKRLGLALALACAAACAPAASDADLQPPPGFRPPAIEPLKRIPPEVERLGFGRGFFPLEKGAVGDSWRWMGDRGEVRLTNDGRARRLHIIASVPLEFLKAPPTVSLAVEGHPVDTFVAREPKLDRTYTVAPETLGPAAFVRLVLATSATAHAPGDQRSLGLMVEKLEWRVLRD